MIFRIATENDTQEILDIFAYYVENTNIAFEWKTPTFDEFKQRIIATLEKYPYIVAIYNNEIVGFGYATTHIARTSYNWNAVLTIYLKRDTVSKGIGSEMLQMLTDILKAQNVVNIYSCIASDNLASVAFHERHNFDRIGDFKSTGFKFGKWHDMCWYGKQIGECNAEMPEFIPFKDVDCSYILSLLNK